MVLHRFFFPDRLRLFGARQPEYGTSDSVIGGDEHLAVRIDGRCYIEVILGLPRIAPHEPAVLGGDADGPRAREEDDLGGAAALDPDRAALADWIVQRLPNNCPVIFIQGRNR